MKLRRFLMALPAVTALLLPAPVQAQEPAESPDDDGGGRLVDFGAGLLFVAGGNFLDKPSDKTLPLPGGGRGQTESYPGFGGTTIGGGLMLDVRFIKLLGLEVDVLRTTDKGTGDITFNNVTTIDITLEQSAWHVPILAKVVLPLPVVRPMFFLGPELVFPGDATATVEPNQPGIDAHADNYVMITGGAGVEIKLPTPGIDLRIPISFRGSVNPSTSDKLEDRVDAEIQPSGLITQVTYNSEWKYQALFAIGAAAYF